MGMKKEDYIKKFFSYNPKTGLITRVDRNNSNGSYDKHGYLILKIKGKQYKAHRVAWFLFYGKFPDQNIDHINNIRDDNRIINLRDVSQSENNKNNTKKINKDTNEYGICLDKTKGLNKKYVVNYLGKTYRFYTIEEAKIFKTKIK